MFHRLGWDRFHHTIPPCKYSGFPQHPPPTVFAVFVIEHLEFSAEYVWERLNKWNTCECIKTKTSYTFHSCITEFCQNGQSQQTEDSSMNLFKSNVRILIYQKHSTQNIELVGGYFLLLSPRLNFHTEASATSNPDCNKIGEKLLFSWLFYPFGKNWMWCPNIEAQWDFFHFSTIIFCTLEISEYVCVWLVFFTAPFNLKFIVGQKYWQHYILICASCWLSSVFTEQASWNSAVKLDIALIAH